MPLIPADDGQQVYVETLGRGVPLVHVHGGPGAGAGGGYRRRFDTECFQVIGYDQRGCGRSRPRAGDLAVQTLEAQVADLESVRRHFGIERWIVCGVSWGTTVALAYAAAHPERVIGVAAMAVTLTTAEQVRWTTETVGRLFPAAFHAFSSIAREPGESIVAAYHRAIRAGDDAAVEAWCRWEDAHVALDGLDRGCLAEEPWRDEFALLVTHYWSNARSLHEGLSSLSGLEGVPGVLVHGALDVSLPVDIPWMIHQRWPGSRLVVVPDEGHGGPKQIEALVDAVQSFHGRAE